MPPGQRHTRMNAQLRLLIGIGIALPVALLLPTAVPLGPRLLAAWDAFALTYLSLVWLVVARLNAAEARRTAEAQDVQHRWALFLVLTAAIAGFFSAVVVLHQLREWGPVLEALVSALGLAAIVLAWFLTHALFGLHYMHTYYGSGHSASGLVFPGEDPPDGADFQYFAFTVGMTFQVSDVTTNRPAMRRQVLRHALLSFAYSTVIIALTINLIASRL